MVWIPACAGMTHYVVYIACFKWVQTLALGLSKKEKAQKKKPGVTGLLCWCAASLFARRRSWFGDWFGGCFRCCRLVWRYGVRPAALMRFAIRSGNAMAIADGVTLARAAVRFGNSLTICIGVCAVMRMTYAIIRAGGGVGKAA